MLPVIRFNMGTATEMFSIRAAGGTHNDWTPATIPLTSNPQDELFIGFVMGDPINGTFAPPGAWARIDNLKLYNSMAAQTDLPDYSFENWVTAFHDVLRYFR